MVGLFTEGPCDVIWNATQKQLRKVKITKIGKRYLKKLRRSLKNMHKKTNQSLEEFQDRRNVARFFKYGVTIANYTPGDYVLKARIKSRDPKVHKLACVWTGPYRVTKAINDYTYELEDLITGNFTLAHAARLRRYFDESLDVDDVILSHVKYAKTSYQYEAIVDHRFNQSTLSAEVNVKWLGFSKKENTWEPLQNAYEDFPELVIKYLSTVSDSDAVKLNEIINSFSTTTASTIASTKSQPSKKSKKSKTN